jgi:ABC-2 type transport system permease protein
VKLLAHQLRNEQRLYWRSRELAFFTFLFPVLIFVLLGSVYGNDKIKSEHNVKGSHYLLAGMLGYGLASTAFAGLAIIIVIRRESAILKRLRGTPLPAWAYIAATLISAIFVFAIEVVVLLVLAKGLFDVPFPSRILSLALALLLGSAAFAAMAIGLTTVIRSAEGSSAVVNAVYLPMAFPRFLEVIADVLPLTYFIRMTRDIVLRHAEIWNEGTAVGVVAAWGVVGLLFAFRGFRWEPRDA